MRIEGTKADRRRWEQRLGQFIAEGRIGPVQGLRNFREMFCAGEWLGEQLLAFGVPERQASDICFANGQRTATAPDPWEVARQTLSETKAGRAPVPGRKLSELLTAEMGVAALFQCFIEQGITPSQMEALLDKWREGTPPEEEASDDPHAHLLRGLRALGPMPDRVIDRCLVEYTRAWSKRP